MKFLDEISCRPETRLSHAQLGMAAFLADLSIPLSHAA